MIDQPPESLVRGCNDPVSIGVLSDWIEEQYGIALDCEQSGWDDEYDYNRCYVSSFIECYGHGNGNGYGNSNGYGSGRGDGKGNLAYSGFYDGYGYGYISADGNGHGYGNRWGNGRGWGYCDGYSNN